MRVTNRLLRVVATLGLLALAHCAASGGSSDTSNGAPGAGGGGGASGGGGSGGFGGGGGSGGLPPEKEAESSFRSPVATGRFVWSANPDSGRVALVDAMTLDVHTVEAGFGPTWLAALPDPANPDANAAVVINVLSHDATVLRATDSGDVATTTVPVHAGANSWAVSASGRYAIAWTDSSKVQNPDPTEGFQDVTVIDLSGGGAVATRLSVGYRPTSVMFSADDSHVYIVTEPGISVIDLSGSTPAVLDDVQVTDDPVDNPASRDVSITPDGGYALVRLDGSPDVGVVKLDTGARVKATLSAPVTDLDLSADGSVAVAVARDTSEVAILPVPAIFAAPDGFDSVALSGETIGSVSLSPSGDTALLYTNATPSDHLTILDTRVGDTYLVHRTVALRAPVQSVLPTPDAAHAIALLAPGTGSTRAGAFSVVPVATDLPPRIQGTDAPPIAVALSPAPTTRAVIATRDDSTHVYSAYVVRMPELQVDRVPLSSPPLATGMVPAANKAYVAEEYPEGRITFIDLSTGSAHTLTGFELGAKVVDGTP